MSAVWVREELAWAAGVIEGEGCFTPHRQGARIYPRVVVQMTDLDVVERLQRAFGLGHITEYKPPTHQSHWKRSWRWQITSGEHAAAVMVAVYPWLGERRRARVREVLQALRRVHCASEDEG